VTAVHTLYDDAAISNSIINARNRYGNSAYTSDNCRRQLTDNNIATKPLQMLRLTGTRYYSIQRCHRRPLKTYCLATISHDWHTIMRYDPSRSMIFVWKPTCDFLLVIDSIGFMSHRLATINLWQTGRQTTDRRTITVPMTSAACCCASINQWWAVALVALVRNFVMLNLLIYAYLTNNIYLLSCQPLLFTNGGLLLSGKLVSFCVKFAWMSDLNIVSS